MNTACYVPVFGVSGCNVCDVAQEMETLLWAICRLEHRADKLVAEMAKEVGRSCGVVPVGVGGRVTTVLLPLLCWKNGFNCVSVARAAGLV